jgi:ferredoxin
MTNDNPHIVDKLTPIVLSFTCSHNQLRERKFKMTYQINADECIACGACEAECSTGAISESNGTYVIDAAKCEDCGSCADVCPVGAPVKI